MTAPNRFGVPESRNREVLRGKTVNEENPLVAPNKFGVPDPWNREVLRGKSMIIRKKYGYIG
jgi:hypothetical protein